MDVDALINAVEQALAERNKSKTAPTSSEPVGSRDDWSRVAEVLGRQAEFSAHRAINHLGVIAGFGPPIVARLLLQQATQRGSAKLAVQWLEKILGTQQAVGISVQTLWGVTPTNAFPLLDDLEIVPFASLPASRQKDVMSNTPWPIRPEPVPLYLRFAPGAALITTHMVAFFADAHGPADSGAAERFERLGDARLCLAMSAPTPAAIVPGPAWFQYLDPDLDCAVAGSSTMTAHVEVMPVQIEEAVGVDLARTRHLLLDLRNLAPSLRGRVRIAMERLQMSLARRSPGDRALELAIALETLLIERPGENTFKIALRAALISGDSQADRLRVRSVIESVYGLRSALMHSGRSPAMCNPRGFAKQSALDLVGEATNITATVIRRVVSDGRLPEWWQFEVGE